MSYTILNTLGGEKSATGVIPGTYGSNTSVSQITVDRYGRITAASNVTITGGGGSSQWIDDATGIHYLSTVGIGTPTPGAMLDVVTNATPGVGAIMAQFGTSATARLQFYDENGGLPPYIYGAAGNGLGLASSGPIQFYPNENPIGSPMMYVNSGGVGVSSTLAVAGDTILSSNLTVAGHVGIGTTNPTSNLTVIGDAFFEDYTSSTSILTLPLTDCTSIAYGNGYFVTVSSSGLAVFSSDNGYTWTAAASIPGHSWSSVTFGNGYFVAVSDAGFAAFSSDNGNNWTDATVISSHQWTSVVYDASNFVTVNKDGSAAFSSDNGDNWTDATVISSHQWISVTVGNGYFVTVSNDGFAAFSSDNGDNWTDATFIPGHSWTSVTFGNGYFVAVSVDGFSAFSSDNGDNWTDATIIPSHQWGSVTYGNGNFVAVTPDGVASYSDDNGDHWADATIPNYGWSSVTFGNGYFVTVSRNDGFAAFSTDNGITWSNYTFVLQNNNFVHVSNGNLYVANALTTTNVFTKLVQFSNTIDIYTSTIAQNFTDSPYTTALSSDGTTLVNGYMSGGRIDIFDVATLSVVYSDNSLGGWSVSINANATVLVVGDPTKSEVAIYRKTGGTWALERTIGGSSSFGYSVSINSAGDKFLVCDTSTSFGGSNPGLADSAYMYTYSGSWNITTTFNFSDPVSAVALSGDGTTCVFGSPVYAGVKGRVYITKDLGVTYTTFHGDNVNDYFGYYVSSNYDGTRIVANSSSGDPLNYIKIFTLE
jgi:hypothetical protein